MKTSIRRLMSVLLCLAMLVMLAACGGGKSETPSSDTPSSTTPDSTPAPSDGGGSEPSGEAVSSKDTLTIAGSGDQGTLNPLKIMGNFAGIQAQYMQHLIDFTEDGTLVPVLAESIEEVSDKLWIFHLRKGVTFSNGNPFNADDVMYTLKLHAADPVAATKVECLDLEHAEVVDEYTINMPLVYYSTQQMGSLTQISILDAESFNEDEAAVHPVGTGPYVVSEYVINSHIYLDAREDYWGEPAKIKHLHFKLFTEDAQIVNAIRSGDVDVAGIPNQDVEFVKTLSDYDVMEYSTRWVPMISFNVTDNSIMKNLDARLAIAHAIDRNAIINLSYFNCAKPLYYPVSQFSLDYDDSLAKLHEVYQDDSFNLDVAKEYAEKAGLVGKELTLISNGASDYVSSAQIIQATLKEIGISIKIQNYDAATFYSNYCDPTQWDIALWAASSPQGYAAGLLYDYTLFGTPYYNGWEKFDEFLALGKKCVGTADRAEQKSMLKDLSLMFEDGLLWYAFCDQMSYRAVNKGLDGIRMYAAGGVQYAEWYWK